MVIVHIGIVAMKLYGLKILIDIPLKCVDFNVNQLKAITSVYSSLLVFWKIYLVFMFYTIFLINVINSFADNSSYIEWLKNIPKFEEMIARILR